MFTPHGVLGGGSYHQSHGGAPDASVLLGKGKGRVTELEQEFFFSIFTFFRLFIFYLNLI